MQTVDEMIVGGIPTEPTPHPDVAVYGDWTFDLSSNAQGDVYSFNAVTDENGTDHILDGRIPAAWQSGVLWNVDCGGSTTASGVSDVTLENPDIVWGCVGEVAQANPSFVLTNATPSSITLNAAGLTSANGMPQMRLYQPTGLASQVYASSVSPDGTSATFNFPTSSSDGPLASGLYGFNVINQTSPGTSSDIATGLLSIGANSTSLTTPYGIDAYDAVGSVENCVISSLYGTSCTTSSTGSEPSYVVTLSAPGQLCRGQSPCIGVGVQPTAVKTYDMAETGTSSSSNCSMNYVTYEYVCYITATYVTEPQDALVANYGSNDISIVDLSTMTVSATIPVGVEPAAVVVSPDGTNAFVANYGSNTISEINLSTNSVAATLTVGTAPDTLALDSSGNYLWIAGLNYISEVSLSSFTVLSTSPVSGQVTALGVSGKQNEWVYTTVSTDLSDFRTQDAAITTGSPLVHSEADISTVGTYYALGGGGGSAPPPYLKASAVVSSSYGNGIAVTSSPTGFVVTDLVAHRTIMQGTTPTPVRGIATDPAEGVAYLTAPESNSLITVPLPPAPPGAQ